MIISRFKAVFALLTGGLAGIIKYFLDVFNVQVLSRITNKETGLKYMRDVQAVYGLLRTILSNHAADISEKRKVVGEAILSAMEELTKALEDFNITEEELDKIITDVKTAIDAWKAAKK